MANELNNLFTAAVTTAATSNRELAGTAQLTATAQEIVNSILATMNADIDQYRDMIAASQRSHADMDRLVTGLYELQSVDVSYLDLLSEEDLNSILKSQQSKRSRCKSKQMTMDNYKAMMNAAVCENLVRMATGKTKGNGGSRRVSGSVGYTVAELEQLANDQEALRKAIRNIQSKISIAKSKADFDETSERFLELKKVEQQLKDMRVSVSNNVVEVEVDTTKDALSDMLADVDFEHMKAADAKELLAKIASLTAQTDAE